MRITVDGLSLLKWCKTHNRKYSAVRYGILAALKQKRVKKPKKTYEDIKAELLIRNRVRYGYSEEEALLGKDEFNKLRAQKVGSHKIGKYNLRYVCNKLGVNYNTVFIQCIKRQRMTPEEYLESKGYDLTQFEE